MQKTADSPLTNTPQALVYEAPFSARIWNLDNEILMEDDGLKAKLCVRSLYSGLSRGTERLVFEGRLPESEWSRMRAPFQRGDFPFPVRYGYSAVGRVEAGPDALIGRIVFALHPHQTRFVIPADMAIPIPDHIPARRAILAANMETALNALWDSGAVAGNSIAVIGGGLVGLLISYLAARLPGTEVTLIDLNPQRANIAQSFGAAFRRPGEAGGNYQIVFHTSASQEGLRLALEIAAFEARIIEVSWFGDKDIALPLGGAFHSQRLQIISSQVGHVAKPFRFNLSHKERLAKALMLLDDTGHDSLITEEVTFEDLPAELPRLLAADALGIATAICY